MEVYNCDSCGAQAKKKKPVECPLCHATEFSKSTVEDPSVLDKKEDELLYDTIEGLDTYDEGTEHRDPRAEYRCPCAEHAKDTK